MMEHASAHNLVEGAPKLLNPLNRKLTEIKIFEIVFSLEFARMS
jgi:hypothetical protein